VHPRTYLPLLLVVTLLLALTLPALAEGTRFSHTADYLMDGYIQIDKEIGDPCETGAAKNQNIRGYGQMTKSETLDIAAHIIAVEDTINWQTAEDALRNLEVTSTIELCARPMVTADDDYQDGGYDIKEGDVISPYHPLVVDGLLSVTRKTDQVWAASASANPGHTGAYETDFIAAYGPGPYELDLDIFKDDYLWEYDPDTNTADDYGDRYVGNYFDIDQYLFTSSGEARRYVSISSPFSFALAEETMEVIGTAEVTDSFNMDNLEPGPDAITLAWYELF